jgi:hypothetical protein
MRTGPFSNDQVIRLLTQYFVPVWLSSDEYGCSLGEADRAEWKRIADGQIMVYVIAPGGSVPAKMSVTKALDTENNLLPMLRKVVQEQKLKPRDAAAIRASASSPPTPTCRTEGGLMFHVFTAGGRDSRHADEWVELASAEWSAFAPPAKASVGFSWTVSRKAVDKLYRHFYPAVCNYKAENSKIEKAALTATVIAVSGSEVRLVLRGRLQMRHDVTDVKDQYPGYVIGDFVGVARYDRTQRTLTAFQLASESARYQTFWKGTPGGGPMAIAVELVNPVKP